MNTTQNHNYIQIIWKAQEQVQEIIMTVVADLGFESFEQKEHFLYGYIPENVFNEDSLCGILGEYPVIEDIPYEIKYIPAQNWNAVWESNFTPVELYPDVLIRAEYHKNSEDGNYKQVILIQPKMAFGTGHHETTQMMLKAMKKLDFQNKTVLDVGCGSGILSIYASMLGATGITAIDIDTWCVENTEENAVLNRIKNIEVCLGDISIVVQQEYDVVLANINRNIIVSQMETYKLRLRPNGYLIISGFLYTDKTLIENKANDLDMEIIQQLNINDWVCMVLRRKK